MKHCSVRMRKPELLRNKSFRKYVIPKNCSACVLQRGDRNERAEVGPGPDRQDSDTVRHGGTEVRCVAQPHRSFNLE